jgi:hypothetical protein
MTDITWTQIGAIQPSADWLLTTLTDGNLIKFEHTNPPRNTSLQIAQTDGTVWEIEPRTIRGERETQVLELTSLLFTGTRRIALRYANHEAVVRNWTVTISSAKHDVAGGSTVVATPTNTPWQDYALSQSLRWLFPLDGRVDAAGLPVNLVSGSPQSAPRFTEDPSRVTRRRRVVGDSWGYEWRAVPPCSTGLSYNPSDPVGELYLDSPATNQFCFGMTLIIPRDASLIGDLLNPFTKSWMAFGSVRGLLLQTSFANGNLMGWNGNNSLFDQNISNVMNGNAFRLGCRCDPTNASQTEVYVNGYRFANFNWNRSATSQSSWTYSALGLLWLDVQQYGMGFSVNDFWLAEGFQTKRIMELMGGY